VSVDLFLNRLLILLLENPDRSQAATRAAESLAAERRYHWVGLYEVTPGDIGMIACTGTAPPAFPRFPISKGLCGSAVALRSIVNVGNVLEDPRWLTTFGSTRSEIIVPVITIDGTVAGLIDVESELLSAFSTDDELFLTRCAPLLLPLFSSSPHS
jgi:L-methionine (R)-S-oxide reductase